MTEETMKWLFNNGLAIVVLASIAYGGVRGGKAFLTVVLVPLRDAGISLFHSQTQNLQEQSKMMQKQGEMMEKQGETMERTNDTLQRVCNELTDARRDVAAIKAQTERCKFATLPMDRTG
jgi:hypothetical protein